MFGVIYTPTEGDAIQNYSRLFRRPEGCFLDINDQDRIDEALSNFGKGDDVDYIVVSDGEEVLFPCNGHRGTRSPMLICPVIRFSASETRASEPFSFQSPNWSLLPSVRVFIHPGSFPWFWIVGLM